MATQFLRQENIVAVQGDSLMFAITLVDENDAPINITSWDITARVGTRSDPDYLTGAVTKTAPTLGEFVVEFGPGATATLVPNQQYTYQIRVDDTGDIVKTPLRGIVTVIDSLFV